MSARWLLTIAMATTLVAGLTALPLLAMPESTDATAQYPTPTTQPARNEPWLRFLRPPGALGEKEFLARCIRCLRCVNACPNSAIIVLDDSFGPQSLNTPSIKARRQACMLCNQLDGDYLK